MTEDETAEIFTRLRDIGERQNDFDEQHIALLWPAFGLQRHLRSESAWRSAALFWEDYAYTDHPPSHDQRWRKLGEVLALYNEFYREPIAIDDALFMSLSGAWDAWEDSNEDDDEWHLYTDVCRTLGLWDRPDWTAINATFRKLLDRPDCYNDVSRTRYLWGDFLWRARSGWNSGSPPRVAAPDGHRSSSLRSRMRH